MLALQLPAEELAHGRPYAERDDEESAWHDRAALQLWHGALAPLLSRSGRAEAVARRLCEQAQRLAPELAALDDAALQARFRSLGPALRRQGFRREPVAQCFAIVREAAGRVLGLRHYDSQLMAGWWLLGGHLAEMATGEGKTFAATLPVCAAALARLPVHVITVNDYLASRDAEAMGPLYAFLGLSCSAVVHGMSRGERRLAYASAVCYASNKELAFDYLRDRAALLDRASPMHLAVESLRGERQAEAQVVLRGLCFAIVDEADSVFIDEARTPLILSRTAAVDDGAASGLQAALELARGLRAAEHFDVDMARRRVRLTAVGEDMLESLADDAGGSPSPRTLRENVQRALAALWLYARDEHYVVIDDKVQIVDASTGRVMPDRAWEQGLHQMIECKEGVPVTGQRETLARITYQRLFRRYLHLAGMTGTATEVAAEIGRTYRLPVARVPLHRPSQRRDLGLRCLPDAAAKWQAVAGAVEQMAVQQGRPVLIGTRTVRASEEISAVLASRGLVHVVLNAKQDHGEAELIAQAGQPGRITVATNMAGRGTDILLGDGVASRGGLHVILTEYNESRRIDRQLVGRSARQGDPGSAEAIVALDDEVFTSHSPRGTAALRAWWRAHDRLPAPAVRLLRWLAQGHLERMSRESREAQVRQDRRLAQMLSFSGRGE
ncbi:preprotein translocase subunit SecA [Roseateles sp. P5_E7]